MILFTADWHIKLGQKNVPVSFATNRYTMLFQEIYDLEEHCNMHIIGGDLFDRIPSMDELQLYFSFIRSVKIPTVIFDGNHEATRKNKTFFTQLKTVSRDINPLVNVVDISYIDYDLGYGILPYADLHRKGSIDHFDTSMPLFTHVRGEIPPHVKPEINLDLLEDFPVVFAGDLHAHSNCQRNIVYPGSPMTTSFHRNEVDTGYILIDPDGWDWTWHKFNIPQLIRKTVTDPTEMIPTPFHHTIYELQGDMEDLANVKNSELLDKKVVRKNTDTALILDKEMSIGQELVEYLTYILELEEEKIPRILGIFNDYTSKLEMG